MGGIRSILSWYFAMTLATYSSTTTRAILVEGRLIVILNILESHLRISCESVLDAPLSLSSLLCL